MLLVISGAESSMGQGPALAMKPQRITTVIFTEYGTLRAVIKHFDWGYAANGTTLFLLFSNERR
ncbi:hypothetical protein [Yokenella regensburgei]|uniref:hypothetical protein n=1 Tax=Yokenella regensburgei TaxID=158877 RepID=UPI0035B24812